MRVTILALAAIIIASCSALPSTDYVPGGTAIIYGISLYDTGSAEGSGLNLTFSDDDAESLAQLFADQGYKVILRTNEDATRANLVSDIGMVADTITPQENFVLYFSGHGARLPPQGDQTNEPANRDDSDEWIFLYGSIDISSVTDLTKAICDNEIQSILSAVPTEHKVVFLDACNSGGFIGTQVEIDMIPQDTDGPENEGILDAFVHYFQAIRESAEDLPASEALVVSAAGEQEDTYEYSLYGHSVFTYHLLNTASQADADNDGYVGVGESYAYVKDMVDLLWQSTPFSPRISGGPVDFALFRSSQ